LLDTADKVFFEKNFGKGVTSSIYAVAVRHGNQASRKIAALIPFGLAVAGFGISSSLLPPKQKSVSAGDQSYFKPRTKKDFEESLPQIEYKPSLRGSISEQTEFPPLSESVPLEFLRTKSYNPYSTGLYRNKGKKNRRKRRNVINF
jgi:hypothetical protein